MAKIIDGKAVSAALRCKITKEVAELTESGIKPGLAVILVGDDPASAVYVRNKKKACAEVGIESFEYRLDASTTNEQLLELIDELNTRADVDGILCQLPLPKHLDEAAVIDRISPEKDVDCFHKINVGKTMLGEKGFLPCTPAGVMELLMQSQTGEIYILPALPAAWDKGEISGIKAKNGATVSIKWNNGKAAEIKIVPAVGGDITIGYEKDNALTINGVDVTFANNKYTIANAKAGTEYVFVSK